MQAKAEARYIRTSPQKIRLVIDLIRGQRAGDAINILRTTNKRIAPSIEKVLRSAIANAENRHNDVDVDKLMVTECYVNEGPRMKRVRPAPMGRRLSLPAADGAYRGQGWRRREGRGQISMGQKVHPYGFRLGVTKTWRSRWFAKQDYAKLLAEDLELKDSLRERLKAAGVSSVEVDRPGNKLRITIHTSRPGIIIGRKGAEIEKLKSDLAKKTKREVFIDIQEVHKPELDAQLVSESIALQLEKRVAFRRAMRKAVDSALRFGCKGIKVRVSGRLNGAEIARTEWYLQGQLPLHTLRADIDYGFSEAHTTYGVIGVKCWVYKGEILPGGQRRGLRNDPEPRRAPSRDRRDRDRGDRPDRGPQAGWWSGIWRPTSSSAAWSGSACSSRHTLPDSGSDFAAHGASATHLEAGSEA